MIRLLVCNQRGGVGKTTTVVTLARCFAEKGNRTLVIDMDPQGSIQSLLGLNPPYHLYNFLIERRTLADCVAHLPVDGQTLDVLASNRSTNEAEIMLYKETLREFILATLMRDPEKAYDVVIVDTSPSISLFQNCAAVYCQNTIIPIDMDVLSVQGAYATLHAQRALGAMLQNAAQNIPMRVVGLLPVKVHRGLQATDIVLRSLDKMSEQLQIPILPNIRTDQAVQRAGRKKSFIADIEPKSKALEDYALLTDHLIEAFGNGNASSKAAPQA